MRPLREKIAATNPRLLGWCSEEKAIAMAEMIVQYQPLTVVEIGVFGGRSMIAMAMACAYVNRGRVYGIDPWTRDDALDSVQEKANVEWWGKLDYEGVYRGCVKAVVDHELTHACSVFRTTSERAVCLLDEVDLLHIDGNHSEVASTRDVRLWLPKVKPGGHIWFDDIDWVEEGVNSTAKALGILVESCERLPDVGNCAVFRKPLAG